MKSRLPTALVVAVSGAMLLATPALAYQDHAGSFTDDDGDVHEANIEAILDEDITDGCNPPDNDAYCPDDFVTRGQMAKFLDRAKDLPESAEDYFTDDEDSLFENSINDLAAADITDGCNPPENTEYCPEDFITRGQMAKFLVRTFAYPATDTDHFSDDEDSIFEADINALREAGVTFGCNPPDNTEFCPDDNVTRAQMASFIARALDLKHEDPTPFDNETCDPAYSPCVPTVEETGDLDCDTITEEYPDGVENDLDDFGDPHELNQDGDDMACELGDPATL